ncbi:MAG TPA: GNAT family N-acetyltransferase [Anaerolineae bacterium]|nr:GNAT family N-acetyltransferase [Anaerolineae bacterium]
MDAITAEAVTQALEVGAVGWTTPEEREQILHIAQETGVFSAHELETVDELLRGYYGDPEASGYHFLSCREGDRVLGFAAWGPRSLSERGYDLYWIATRPGAQGRGVGRALMQAAEAHIRARGGYWIVIETSDTPPYAPARRFYESCGYRRATVLPDFYRDGDGLVIYTRRIA